MRYSEPMQNCCTFVYEYEDGAFRLKGNAGGDSWKNIIVILNSAKHARSVDIPHGNYTVVCREGVINEAGLGTVSGSQVSVPAQSAMILHD